MENPILDKSYKFSLAIVKLCLDLQKDKKEFILSRQLLKSGTSIGANAEEAIGGYSKKDFSAKLSISYKEARESKYWLRLMRDSELIEKDCAEDLLKDCEELLKILFSIIKSARK